MSHNIYNVLVCYYFMPEKVETGGLMRFDYAKQGPRSKLSTKEKEEISKAYEAARLRKRKERRNRIIIWLILVILALALISFLIL